MLVDGSPRGTAFFVAPGRALTCAHVVAVATGQPDRITLRLRDRRLSVETCRCEPMQDRITDPYPLPDAALLGFAADDHPWVSCQDAEPVLYPEPDRLYTAGWTDTFERRGRPRLIPASLRYEGGFLDTDWADGEDGGDDTGEDAWRLQLRDGRISGGMSGAPVLNERTGRVCAMLTRTRDAQSDLGGWAVPVGRALDAFVGHIWPAKEPAGVQHERWFAVRQDALYAQTGAEFRSAYRSLTTSRDVRPSVLLRPEYGVVPFLGRRSELDELMAWCTSGQQAAVRLLAGQAGAGKTRLAAELCDAMARQGWTAGFLSGDGSPKVLDRLRERGDPVLAVLDYGDTHTGLHELLSRLDAPEGTAPPTRLLVLARNRKTWSRRIREAASHIPVVQADLAPLVVTREARRDAHASAAAAFAARLGTAASVSAARMPQMGTQPILVLHMSALLQVLDNDSAVRHGVGDEDTRRVIVRSVLDRESSYWGRSSAAAGLSIDDELIRRVVTSVALFGAQKELHTAQLLRTIPDLADAPAERLHAMARWALSFFPTADTTGVDHDTEILQPDLLLEQLVSDTLIDCPTMLESLATVPPESAERAWLILDRACTGDARLIVFIEQVLRSAPVGVLRSLVSVAERSEGPLQEAFLKVMAGMSEGDAADRAAMLELAESIPVHSVVLQDAGITLWRKAIDSARKSDGPCVADLLNRLAVRLSKIGRRSEAADTSVEALSALRENAMAGDPPTRLLAGQLLQTAERLKDGAREWDSIDILDKAREIVEADSDEDPAWRIEMLADTLPKLSRLSAALGRGDDAKRYAVAQLALLRRLEEIDDPRTRAQAAKKMQESFTVLRPYVDGDQLITALQTLHQARMEATATGERPEAERIGVLRAFSFNLKRLGRETQAMDALRDAESLCRSLLDVDFLSYGPELSTTLGAKTNLGDEMNREEIVDTQKEIVRLRQRIAELDPTSENEAALARALTVLGSRLSSAGYAFGAVNPTEEGVAILRELAEKEHGTRWRHVASALATLAWRLASAGLRQRALIAEAESLSIVQRLAASDFRRYGQVLAGAYINAARLYSAAGAERKVKEAARQAVNTARRLCGQPGTDADSDLSGTLAGAGLALAAAGLYSDALPMLAECVELRRTADTTHAPDVRAAELLRGLGYLADTFAAMENWDSAVPLADEAFTLSVRALLEFPEDRSTDKKRRSDTEQFYASLIRLHGLLRERRRFTSAHRISTQGLEILDQLAERGNGTAKRLRTRRLPPYEPVRGLRNPSQVGQRARARAH
ncbi:trypsin-like peptidase domain-containing protein [Streptomyces sp. NPDC057575]|uniref:trypsin-like peptidase domain-containing protein n=1 Tax=unclassified Streptomyces TaxID=2593676 RepID=UPI0036CABFAA